MTARIILFLSIAIFVCLILFGGAQAQHPDDIYWESNIASSCPGVNGIVRATVNYNGMLIVGGNFTIIGESTYKDIAAWDGEEWHALGDGIESTDGGVSALAVFNDKLYVAGSFSYQGDYLSRRLLEWDGSNWTPMVPGIPASSIMNFQVNALQVYDNKLFVGGDIIIDYDFSKSGLIAWDGSNWSFMEVEIEGAVTALTVYKNELIVAGLMIVAGGADIYCIAAWDKTIWKPLGTFPFSMVPHIYALEVFDNKLIVAGDFDIVDSVRSKSILSWDGTTWSSLSPWTNHSSICNIQDLLVHDNLLYAVGKFKYMGEEPADNIASWNGTEWMPLLEGVESYYFNSTVYTICEFNDNIIIGGYFSKVSGIISKNIAIWDGYHWSKIEDGRYPAGINTAIVYQNKLIVGGVFEYLGEMNTNCIVSWDDSDWGLLGSGVCSPATEQAAVRAMCIYDEKLIVAGHFSEAGNVAANSIASWDGEEWNTFDSGLVNSAETTIHDLEIFNNLLVACGSFELSNGEGTNLAIWINGKWTGIGGGFDSTIYSLTTYQNNLIIGGRQILKSWDGIGFYSLDSITSEFMYVYALAEFDGNLIVGGDFRQRYTDLPSDYVVGWDGSSWFPLENGTSDKVEVLNVWNGNLYAGGEFGIAGEILASRISMWNGEEWNTLGSGLNGDVAMIVNYNNQLVVGGSFNIAGNKVAIGLATWTKRSPTDIDEDETPVLPTEFSLSQNYPNPFNPSTSIEFSLPKSSHVIVSVFNLLGQKVRELTDKEYSAGNHSVSWDSNDASGNRVASGIYFYRVRTDNYTQTKKMILLK